MTPAKLDFWIENNFNVLFKGKHGCGKTARIVDAFERNDLKWKYFSASTLDPWVDFVGVPKEVTDADGNTYLDLIRPKHFADDDVEAIFLDEYNRAPAKIRNATMELIQFKSINGKKFNNLRFVWVAINPDEDEKGADKYDVEVIDPAQKDRFEIHVDIPYKPDMAFFKAHYGDDIGKVAVNWWHDLAEEEKNLISPRRLEYVLKVYLKNGDLKDVVPARINTSKLITELKNGSYRELMEKIYQSNDSEQARKFMADDNNFNNTYKCIVSNKELLQFYFPYFSDERRANAIISDIQVCKYAISEYDTYKTMIDRLAMNNNMVKSLLQKYLQRRVITVDELNKLSFSGKASKLSHGNIKNIDLSGYNTVQDLIAVEAANLSQTSYRKNAYKMLYSYILFQRGYVNPSAANAMYRPLSRDELDKALYTLNQIIDSTTVYDNYVAMHALYGFVCGELLRKFGYKQDYSKLTNRIKDYISKNSEYYL